MSRSVCNFESTQLSGTALNILLQLSQVFPHWHGIRLPCEEATPAPGWSHGAILPARQYPSSMDLLCTVQQGCVAFRTPVITNRNKTDSTEKRRIEQQLKGDYFYPTTMKEKDESTEVLIKIRELSSSSVHLLSLGYKGKAIFEFTVFPQSPSQRRGANDKCIPGLAGTKHRILLCPPDFDFLLQQKLSPKATVKWTSKLWQVLNQACMVVF